MRPFRVWRCRFAAHLWTRWHDLAGIVESRVCTRCGDVEIRCPGDPPSPGRRDNYAENPW